jgi:hypothetical protein
MKKNLLFVMVAVFYSLTNLAMAQCPRNGDVWFADQTGVDRYFADGGCSVINGNLLIGPGLPENRIRNLNGLSGITQVNGRIEINSSLLTSLNGLSGLQSTVLITLIDNNNLTSMAGLDNLTSLQQVSIVRCHNLTQLSVGKATSIWSFSIRGANSVTNMSGLEGLVSVPDNYISLIDMNSLQNLNGLRNVKTLNRLWIENCPSLTDLSGLDGVTESLLTVHLYNNSQLSACTAPVICNHIKAKASYGGSTNLSGNASGCNSVESLTANCQTSLPITLVKFQGKAAERNVSLSWSTAEETNSREFQVEHSANAKDWIHIGSVKSNENSYTERNYQFTHDKPGVRNYYRLKMVDNDNSFAYSSVVHVMSEQADKIIAVYPNPASDYILIDQKYAAKLSNVQVISLSGKVLLHQNKPTGGKVEIRNLKSGSYIVKARFNDDSETTQRIVVGR